MKKFLSILAISGALLAACSEDQTEEKSADDVLENATVLTDEEVAQLEEKSAEKTDASAKEAETSTTADGATETEVTADAPVAEKALTPEEAKETVTQITETAKEDNVVKDVKVEEADDVVTATINFDKDASEEEKALFIFNYSILIDQQYPEQEIKFNVNE